MAQSIPEYVRRHGCYNALTRATYVAADRLVGFKALRGMTLRLEDVDPKYLACVRPFSCRRLPALEFARLEGASDLASAAFYEAAAGRSDWCHYVSDGDEIASYGWYSTTLVPVGEDTLIRYGSSFVYMYKGFTRPEYRGHQLHAYGMAHAVEAVVADGYEGLISYVEAHNRGSLRSVARLGYRTFGTCVQLRLLGKTLTYNTPGCKRYGFGLVVDDRPATNGERVRRRRANA